MLPCGVGGSSGGRKGGGGKIAVPPTLVREPGVVVPLRSPGGGGPGPSGGGGRRVGITPGGGVLGSSGGGGGGGGDGGRGVDAFAGVPPRLRVDTLSRLCAFPTWPSVRASASAASTALTSSPSSAARRSSTAIRVPASAIAVAGAVVGAAADAGASMRIGSGASEEVPELCCRSTGSALSGCHSGGVGARSGCGGGIALPTATRLRTRESVADAACARAARRRPSAPRHAACTRARRAVDAAAGVALRRRRRAQREVLQRRHPIVERAGGRGRAERERAVDEGVDAELQRGDARHAHAAYACDRQPLARAEEEAPRVVEVLGDARVAPLEPQPPRTPRPQRARARAPTNFCGARAGACTALSMLCEPRDSAAASAASSSAERSSAAAAAAAVPPGRAASTGPSRGRENGVAPPEFVDIAPSFGLVLDVSSTRELRR